MFDPKAMLENSEPNEPCDEHSSLNGISLGNNPAIISLHEDMIEFFIFDISLILKRVPR